MPEQIKTIAVIGAGAVGSTVAYTLMLEKLAHEVILIDANETREEGEVMDMHDALAEVETEVRRGDIPDAATADIIVITAGAAQKPGQTRLDLTKTNVAVLTSIASQIPSLKPSAIVILVTNPVDVIAAVAHEVFKLPANQIFGTGTALDTLRLRSALTEMLHADPRAVEGYVLGEHGDSGFVAWSTVTVGGSNVRTLLDEPTLEKIAGDVKGEAYAIISKKGATFYGIATVVADIVKAIAHDESRVIPVSAQVEGWNGVGGVCIGVPAVIGRNGVQKVIDLTLEPAELERFRASAATLKSAKVSALGS